jgi:nucleoside-diphosphate-sugar epimerase
MTALITGIGYIGAALAESLLADGEQVVGLESSFSTVPAVLTRLSKHPRFTLVRGSINNVRALVRAFEAAEGPVDAVYHLAAQSSAHPQAAPPTYTEQTNLMAPRLVYEAAAAYGAGALVHGSSFRVYGDDMSGIVGESTPYGRINDLSHLSKVYVEKLFEMLAGQHAVPVANVRLGVVYGLGPVMKHDPRFLTVPNLFCLRTVAGEPLTVNAGANRPIGFLHLDDAVQSLRAAANVARARETGAWPVNVVSEVLGVGEVAAIVEREARVRGLSPQIEGAGPLIGPRWSAASSLDAVGFRPSRTMSESLGAVLDYYRSSQ